MPQQAENQGGLDRFDDDHEPYQVTPDELLQEIQEELEEYSHPDYATGEQHIWNPQRTINRIWAGLCSLRDADVPYCPTISYPDWLECLRNSDSPDLRERLIQGWIEVMNALSLAKRTIQEWMDTTNSEPVDSNREVPASMVPGCATEWLRQEKAANRNPGWREIQEAAKKLKFKPPENPGAFRTMKSKVRNEG